MNNFENESIILQVNFSSVDLQKPFPDEDEIIDYEIIIEECRVDRTKTFP